MKHNHLLQAELTQAVEFHQQGKLAEAENLYRSILKSNPKHFDACHLLGVIFLQHGDAAAAVKQINEALLINSGSPDSYSNLGNAFRVLKRFDEALKSYDQSLRLRPNNVEALFNRGNILNELKRHEEALVSYDRALSLAPNHPEILVSRGIALKNLLRFEDALSSYNRAIKLREDYALAYFHRATVLKHLQRYEEALTSLEKAKDLNPHHAESFNNCGVLLQILNRYNEALENFEKAAALNPRYAEAHNNMAHIFLLLKRFEEARASYDRTMALDPSYSFAEGMRLFTRMLLSDWQDYSDSTAHLLTRIRKGEKAILPFPLLALPGTAEDQLKCAETFIRLRHPPQAPLWKGEKYQHKKIRLAYLSADFHAHATAYLMAGLFERHDRSRFEVTAFSFGPDDKSEMRKRLTESFDHFINVRASNYRQIAGMIREKEIDIAVDLKGFTQEGRVNIFAHRPAPVQVNFIGYPGTMSAPYIDYIIADQVVLPPELQPFFTEKVIYLPDTYQVNDRKRMISPVTPSKAELGLPEKGFIFCSFNNTFKITPDIFDIWMRLLREVKGSVLWLLDGGKTAISNLRHEAEKRGVDADRLIFAPRTKLENHLARHRHADLFLDTLPCNAHTTASDALWAGLPVLTRMGNTFASRVAGSLLTAVGLPELITHTPEEYEHLALKLAHEPQRLSAIKEKLVSNRDTCALFDTEGYAQNLEQAYTKMYIA